jgi:hypothetical protein
MPDVSPTRGWRPGIRLTLRALVIVVLLAGLGLGWFTLRARDQRQAVDAIVRAGGTVIYDFEQGDGPFQRRPNGKPKWPAWLVRVLGIDAVATVVSASLGPRDYETVMPRVARLGPLIELRIGRSTLPNESLIHLRGLFRLKRLWMRVGNAPYPAPLENLQGLTSLEELALFGVTDQDLAHLKATPRLQNLSIVSESVTDASMVHLRDLPELKQLNLQRTPVTSAGLVQLSRMTRLERLNLLGTQVDDLAPIGHLNRLLLLWVTDAPLGDRGTAAIAGLAHLRILSLAGTNISDEALVNLSELKDLGSLDVSGTRVTDAGLARLRGLVNLKELFARGTKVSDEGIAELRAALPRLSRAASGRLPQTVRPR